MLSRPSSDSLIRMMPVALSLPKRRAASRSIRRWFGPRARIDMLGLIVVGRAPLLPGERRSSLFSTVLSVLARGHRRNALGCVRRRVRGGAAAPHAGMVESPPRGGFMPPAIQRSA